MNYRVLAAGVATSALLAFTIHKLYTGSQSRDPDAPPPVSTSVASPEKQLAPANGNAATAVTPRAPRNDNAATAVTPGAPQNGSTLPGDPTETGSGSSSRSELDTKSGDRFLRSFFAFPEDSSAKSATYGTPPDGSADQLNQLMNSEARDEYWAANAETRLQDYLARQPNADRLQLPDIECRATVCRILTTVDTATLQLEPSVDLAHAMSGFQFESESKQFDTSAEMAVMNPKFPDKVGFAMFLRRAPPDDPDKP